MSDASRYGKFYWGIKQADGASMNFYADKVEVTCAGALVASHEAVALFVFAPGQWIACWAASILDGSPVAQVIETQD